MRHFFSARCSQLSSKKEQKHKGKEKKMACVAPCQVFDHKKEVEASLYVGLTTFICFLIFGCPALYAATSFLKTTAGSRDMPFLLRFAPSWWGWILHAVVAGAIAIGIGYGFMQINSKVPKCCCPQP